jgi:hypothetical protein
MRRLPIILIATLLLTSGLQGGRVPQSLFGGLVTFRPPPHWKLQKEFTKANSAEVLQMLIPDRDTDNTPDSSNALITAERSEPGISLDEYKSRGAGRPDRGFLTITEIPAGKTWLSKLSHGLQGKTHYIVVDRFGLDSGCFVAFRAACPLIERKAKEWMANFAADCNAVINSLKIRGKNVITSELKLDTVDHSVVLWLRNLNDPAKHFDYRARNP